MVRKFTHIFLLFCVFFLAGVCGANASVSHDHHDEISDSPFQKGSKGLSPHCLLNRHHHPGQDCPHTRNPSGDRQARLAVDCGGNPDGTVPPVSNPGQSHFLFSAPSFQPVFKSAETVLISSVFFQDFFSDPIEHPPQI